MRCSLSYAKIRQMNEKTPSLLVCFFANKSNLTQRSSKSVKTPSLSIILLVSAIFYVAVFSLLVQCWGMVIVRLPCFFYFCWWGGGALRGKWRRAAWQVEVRCVTKCKGLSVVLLLFRAFSLHKFRGFDGGWGILPLRPFEAVKGA